VANDPLDPADRYLRRLGRWRGRRPAYTDLRFIQDHFRRDIERPHRQLGQLIELWADALPDELVQRTRLRSFQRGTLNVSVPDSSTRYRLDRLLRGGVEARVRAAFKGNLRAIKVRVEAATSEGDRRPPAE